MSASDFAPLRELADDQHAISESESALLHRLLREHAERGEALKDIATNYDHEEQTHDHQPFKYGGHCRVCLAERTLAASTPNLGENSSTLGLSTPTDNQT